MFRAEGAEERRDAERIPCWFGSHEGTKGDEADGGDEFSILFPEFPEMSVPSIPKLYEALRD